MGTYRGFREEFMFDAARLGLNRHQAGRIARLAATHNRLAEAECNGDWPCYNGEREVETCHRCESGYVKSAMRYAGYRTLGVRTMICQSCKTEDNIKALCAEYGIGVEFQGDPRGWTVKLSRLESQAS